MKILVDLGRSTMINETLKHFNFISRQKKQTLPRNSGILSAIYWRPIIFFCSMQYSLSPRDGALVT